MNPTMVNVIATFAHLFIPLFVSEPLLSLIAPPKKTVATKYSINAKYNKLLLRLANLTPPYTSVSFVN